MLIISSPTELKAHLSTLTSGDKSIGFVPTMGALHAGHIALVKRSVAENTYTIVSIFVNPTQFNNPTDLEKYPRNLDIDAELLKQAGCNVIFAPQVSDIYSQKESSERFEYDFEGLDKVMEGKFRPGHFNGVVQIVSKLFALVNPHKSYFGEKDFQQLAIIHHMTEKMGFRTEIIDCPIVREPSGLAMSSRNERLSSEQRQTSAGISKVLFESLKMADTKTPNEVCEWVIAQVNQLPGLRVEYYEIANAKTLQTAQDWAKPTVGCIAVFCGEVRLIDNVRYKLN